MYAPILRALDAWFTVLSIERDALNAGEPLDEERTRRIAEAARHIEELLAEVQLLS